MLEKGQAHSRSLELGESICLYMADEFRNSLAIEREGGEEPKSGKTVHLLTGGMPSLISMCPNDGKDSI